MPLFPSADKHLVGVVRRLARCSKPVLTAGAVAATGALAYVDVVAGPYITFSVFYLIPVAMITWYVGRAMGLAMATACGAFWFYDTIGALPPDLPLAIVTWIAVNRIALFIFVMWLVGALRTSLDHHKALASTDDMTGVPNRRAFMDAVSREISRARRTNLPLTVIYADCDNLKHVNDRLGHAVGDKALAAVAQSLQRHLRESDTVARLGGDEFAVLLPETDTDAARAVTAKMQEVVSAAMAQHRWPVTLSMGVVTFIDPPDSPEELVAHADSLQYAVKHGGKNAAAYAVVRREIEAPLTLTHPQAPAKAA